MGVRMENSERQLVDPKMLSIRSQLMTVLQDTLYRDARVDLDTFEVATATLVTETKFNMWFYDVVKKQANEKQFVEFLERIDQWGQSIVAAVTRFLRIITIASCTARFRKYVDEWRKQ